MRHDEKETHEFELGDVVRLKSGGPKMTVGYIHEIEVVCTWFDTQDNPRNEKFYKKQLYIVDNP